MLGWLWSNIFLIGLAHTGSHSYISPPSTRQYWSCLSVYLHSLHYLSLRPHQPGSVSEFVWCDVMCVIVVTRPVQYINNIPCPSVPYCSAHTTSLLHLLMGLSAKLLTNWQNLWIIFHPVRLYENGAIFDKADLRANVKSSIFGKFLLQILINFHGVIPGVLGIFYYNWSLFHVEENIWISKIPSDTHPHPGLIWYLESYPSITV